MEQVLEFIFFVFVIALVMTAVVVYRLYRRLRKNMRDFTNQAMGGFTASSQEDAAHESYSSSSTTDAGDTIIDTRSPQDVNKKIFAKDEGEYVDFKEK
jgi:hypothetical protein